MNVLRLYTGDDEIGMDHPYFMAIVQARMDASIAAVEGLPLPDAVESIRARMQALFGDVPLAMVDAAVTDVYVDHDARG